MSDEYANDEFEIDLDLPDLDVEADGPAAPALMDTPETRVVPIDSVKPYENNPRKIPQTAVDQVARSIELYGWQQPIVVDEAGVVVVGHTRLKAAQKLGFTEVPVHVAKLSPEKIAEYRVVDNRTGELSSWDHDSLVMELREFETGLLEEFFPDVDIEVAQIQSAQTTDADVEKATAAINTVTQASEESLHLTKVRCPDCGELFSVRTKTLPGMLDPEKIKAVINGGGR